MLDSTGADRELEFAEESPPKVRKLQGPSRVSSAGEHGQASGAALVGTECGIWSVRALRAEIVERWRIRPYEPKHPRWRGYFPCGLRWASFRKWFTVGPNYTRCY